MEQYNLVRKDVSADSSMEIATFQVDANHFVVCKNANHIGWASTEQMALDIHDMYMRLHILRENHSGSAADIENMDIRAKSSDNGFLHNTPDEELEKRKKLFWKFLNS